MKTWWEDILPEDNQYLLNENVATLVQRALRSYEGKLSDQGALIVLTGLFTGRAAEDKFVVRDEYTEDRINWEDVRSLTPRQFDNIKYGFVEYLRSQTSSIYLMERSVSADPSFVLGIRLATTSASHSLFARHMFRESVDNPNLGYFTIYHCPDLELAHQGLGLRSSTAIAINFVSKEILISGTKYAGEIKKAVFSVMNTLLPDHGVLPVHAGANVDEGGKVSVFFGLSGTGKTTLSTDIGRRLIGDDEHGLSHEGIFNLEGGCYAKTFKLSEKSEPQIYHAVNRFGTILENVTIDKDHRPLFDDKTITENGRASYPLAYIENHQLGSRGAIPDNIFYLSADAMGVLPAVSRLNPEQAIYYFLSGYTAKLAGTEIGLAGVKTTFSHCFGAPFMMRHPRDYAKLLWEFLERHPIKVWLINTGWYGGSYGIGERYSIDLTRSIIRGIQKGLPRETKFEEEGVLGLSYPTALEGVEKKILNPRALWADQKKYTETAETLKTLFKNNYERFQHVFS